MNTKNIWIKIGLASSLSAAMLWGFNAGIGNTSILDLTIMFFFTSITTFLILAATYKTLYTKNKFTAWDIWKPLLLTGIVQFALMSYQATHQGQVTYLPQAAIVPLFITATLFRFFDIILAYIITDYIVDKVNKK